MKYIFPLLLLVSTLSKGQITGDFADTLTFNQSERTFEAHVPATYNSEKSYALIVGLHGCVGGNNPASGFRNTLKFMADSMDAIIACPNGIPSVSNGQMNEPDDSLILAVIDTMKSRYNISPSEVIITGFSCNGFIAAKFGLDKIYPFKAIIPFNPWITLDHFNNNQFNYFKNMKTCICFGENDPNVERGKDLYNDLTLFGQDAYYNEIPGVGHTTNFSSFNSEFMECIDWVYNDPNSNSALSPSKLLTAKLIGNTLNFIASADHPISISIINAAGQTISNYIIRNEMNVNVDHLPAGIYFWQATEIGATGKFKR